MRPMSIILFTLTCDKSDLACITLGDSSGDVNTYFAPQSFRWPLISPFYESKTMHCALITLFYSNKTRKVALRLAGQTLSRGAAQSK